MTTLRGICAVAEVPHLVDPMASEMGIDRWLALNRMELMSHLSAIGVSLMDQKRLSRVIGMEHRSRLVLKAISPEQAEKKKNEVVLEDFKPVNVAKKEAVAMKSTLALANKPPPLEWVDAYSMYVTGNFKTAEGCDIVVQSMIDKNFPDQLSAEPGAM